MVHATSKFQEVDLDYFKVTNNNRQEPHKLISPG